MGQNLRRKKEPNDLRLPDLPQTYILTEIAETKESFTYKQWPKEQVDNLKNARQALRNYEDLVLLC